ncbi:MAG: hypothetical protein MUC96_32360 [Myxococcaceae bacterium]|nr:hypothetical protein [Myxococcaceae bacterium]
MTDSDLTISILQGIRSDLQQSHRDNAERFAALQSQMDRGFEQVNLRFEQANQRFEVIETALRDVAEQLVMQSRALKAFIDSRAVVEERLDDHEARLVALEQRRSS